MIGGNGAISWTTTAGNIMSRPLIVLNTEDSMEHAAGVFAHRQISGAPVMDGQGRPVGVLTKTDLVRYEREHLLVNMPENVRRAMQSRATPLEAIAELTGFVNKTGDDLVKRWMTPQIFSVDQTAPLRDVISEMFYRHIHRVFVRSHETQELAGVITTFDVLKFLARTLLMATGKN